MPTAPDDKPPLTRAEQKKILLMLVGFVVLLDSTAFAVYRIMHIADRPDRTQQTFVAVWVLATLAVITPLMKRIRQGRRRMRRLP